MDVGRVLKDGWNLFVKDIGPIIVAALVPYVVFVIVYLIGLFTIFLPFAVSAGNRTVTAVGALVGAVVFGVVLVILAALTIPFYMSIIKMVLRRVREGRPAEMRDVTACFDQFGSLLVASIVVGILVGIGFVLFVIPGLYLLTIWIFVFPLIVDRRVGLGEAMRESRTLVHNASFWMVFLNVVVLLAIVALVSQVPIAGILAAGWELVAITVMYFFAIGEGDRLPSAFPGPSSAWQGGGQVGAPYGSPYGAPPWAPGQQPATPYGPPPWASAQQPGAQYGPPPSTPYGPPPSTPYGPPPGAQYGPPPGPPYAPGADPQPYGTGYGAAPAQYGATPQAPLWTTGPAGPAPPAPGSAPPAPGSAPPAPGSAPPAPEAARESGPPASGTESEPESPPPAAPAPPEAPTPPEPPA